MVTITTDMTPTMHSGDARNPHPGPMTDPFACYDLSDGYTVQVTFSPPVESAAGVRIIAVRRYPTPTRRTA
jgi:hypothetical protein